MTNAESILAHLIDGVLVVDHQGIVLHANASAGQLLGTNPSALKGKHFGFPITVGQVQDIELYSLGQLRTAQMLVSEFTWDSEPAFLLSLRDISLQKKAQDELAASRRELEITAAENAQFASLASHDLKEPLRKIQFYVNMIQHGGRLAADEDQKLRKIDDAAQRMQRLIEGIAQLSTVTPPHFTFTRVDLNIVVQQVLEDMELVIAQKNAQLTIEKLPVIDGLELHLYQLMHNLISNALKYSSDDRPPVIIITALTDTAGAIITVSDNGIGFDQAYASQVFSPFKRLHGKKYEGMGIGLTLCKKIVDLHHGSLRATSAVGKGSRFMISLPLRQDMSQ